MSEENNTDTMKLNFERAKEYADLIVLHTTKQSNAWRTISKHLSDAEEEFGAKSSTFQSLLMMCGISESKASKLIQIARDVRLPKHQEIFETVDSWTTLYQVTKLSHDEFDNLIIAAKKRQKLKVNGQQYFAKILDASMVKEAKNALSYSSTSNTLNGEVALYSVNISKTEVLDGKIDEENLVALNTALNELKLRFPFLEINDHWSRNDPQKPSTSFEKIFALYRAQFSKDHFSSEDKIKCLNFDKVKKEVLEHAKQVSDALDRAA
jgi:hypothetical protein